MFLDRSILQWERTLSVSKKAEASINLNSELRPCFKWHKQTILSIHPSSSFKCWLTSCSWQVSQPFLPLAWKLIWDAALENQGWPRMTSEEQCAPASGAEWINPHSLQLRPGLPERQYCIVLYSKVLDTKSRGVADEMDENVSDRRKWSFSHYCLQTLFSLDWLKMKEMRKNGWGELNGRMKG